MTYWLSRPVEALLSEHGFDISSPDIREDIPPLVPLNIALDVLIVGSGYGAAMAALALGEARQAGNAGRRVHVFERGDEYLPDDMPKSLRDLPVMASAVMNRDVDSPDDKPDEELRSQTGLWDIRSGKGVTAIMGNGLGGTSLVNASVAARTPEAAFSQWPRVSLPTAGNDTWSTLFGAVYPKIEALLGVSTVPNPERFSKYTALQATTRALGGEVAPAPLSISFGAPGPHSANHGPCNHCGNCVTGCHSGAKGSLNMNAWPLARQLGTELFTGVTVQSLDKDPQGGWRLFCRLTRVPERSFTVQARTVILAAGSLGSTEILLRSRRDHALPLSPMLGNKFSANGDMLMFSAGQKSKVDALATAPVAGELAPDPAKSPAPGPTIIGKASVPLATDRKRAPGAEPLHHGAPFTLEDGVVPFPIIALWQEMIVTQSFLRRYVDSKQHAWLEANAAHDPLAVSRDMARHSQVLLAMGPDSASGRLALSVRHDAVVPVWDILPGSYFDALHQTFVKAEKKAFDGGHYVPSMAWEPLPEGFGEAVEGTQDLGRNVLTVHPLGGCGMADNAADGVVDARGLVFSGAQDADVHQGLYVLDGAILPAAIGTNPFLSISALSYRLAVDIAMDNDASLTPGWWTSAFPTLDKTEWGRIPAGAVHELPTPQEEIVEAAFSETLVHWFNNDKRTRFPWSSTEGPGVKKVIDVLETLDLPPGDLNALRNSTSLVLSVTFQFSGDQSLERWIENPQMPLQARATLGYDQVGAVLETRPEHCLPLLQLTGSVTLGRRDEVKGWSNAKRTFKAIRRFFAYRREEFAGKLSISGLFKTLGKFPSYWRIAGVHAQWRELVYEFEVAKGPAAGLKIGGRKSLGYAAGKPNVQASLMTLPVRIHNTRNDMAVDLLMEVDPVGITRGPAPLQVRHARDGVAALARIGSFGAFSLRMLMQTHFWSFGAYSYKDYKTLKELDSEPVQGRLAAPPVVIEYVAGAHKRKSRPAEMFFNHPDGKGRVLSRLLRYQPATEPRGPGPRKSLLLVHGLAHSGRVFWTDTIDVNYVQYFLGQDYDVWVLDHRTSASIVEEIVPEDTWDDIAETDVPWAVSRIFEERNGEHPGANPHRVFVFAHCIGAGAVAIAVLRGLLSFHNTHTNKQESMIAALSLHAVAPWLYASGANRARENLWALFKELDLIDAVEPRPHKHPEPEEVIYDRLASTSLNEIEMAQWPWSQMKDDARGPAFQKAIYTRYTIFWGRQWAKANVTEKTRQEFAGMIGAVPIAVLQQVYYSITRGLLSSHDGNNAYVRHDAIMAHWTFPTFFLHGNENTVFDMESSKASADQLVRHRRHVRSGDAHWRHDDKLEPQIYTDHGVWVEVLEGYGHMDMIFGKDVAVDVCPRLATFFDAAQQDLLPETYAEIANNAENRRHFMYHNTTNSHTSPTRRPLAGPIISHPQRSADGSCSLRLWCEAQDFTSNPASGLRVGLTDVDSLPPFEQLRKLRHNVRDGQADEDAWSREFWLYDYQFVPLPDMQRRCWLEYNPQDPDRVELLPRPAANPVKETTDPRVQTLWRGTTLLDWSAMPWFQRQFLDQGLPEDEVTLSFLSGSCLHPGSTFEETLSQSIFAGMCRHVAPDYEWTRTNQALMPLPVRDGQALRGVDHVLLLGDQIYADASAGLFDAKVAYEKYRSPYRKAFGSSAARRLFAHVPSYFTVDDHEVDDNWDGAKQIGPDKKVNPWYAKRMAWLYQTHQREWDHLDVRLWQNFVSAGVPFFLLDTRMERLAETPRSNPDALLSERQRKEFENWLRSPAVQNSDSVFFTTGSALAPVAWTVLQEPVLAAQEDGVLAYPGFLAWLVNALREVGVSKRVFWYTGDPHFSCAAQLTLQHADAAVQITQVCCSGLYSPYAFANSNPHNHRWDTPFQLTLPVAGSAPVLVRGTQTLLTDSRQHFIRSDLSRRDGRPVLVVQAFDALGMPLSNPRSL